MSKLSQVQKIVALLKASPNQKYTAREMAEQIVEKYPEDYREKRQNDRFPDQKAFISQVVAEIGSQKSAIAKTDRHVFWQDKPHPRVYWYDPDKLVDDTTTSVDDNDDGDGDIGATPSITTQSFSEHKLYPILIDYLTSEFNLYCQRIDEKRSKNSRGSGGNEWLHPDIVAMQPVDKEWNQLIRSCVKHGAGQSVRLWSFEVKKELTGSNARKSFFQAVSNSSWANEGYLVATSMSDKVEQELRMLSALHGIGVIILNPENPSESDMVLPAKARSEVDWQSVNRILEENADFKDYIELVSTYYQTGIVRAKDWNKA